MNEHTEVRVTKWLQNFHYAWCVNECRRIKKSTGDQCKIEKEGKDKNSRIAVMRIMTN
jgi:hypothetical protein|tara:strand:- start:58 stop:231 length:174 start_codon:yes stop_codon:yes gene_type:complete